MLETLLVVTPIRQHTLETLLELELQVTQVTILVLDLMLETTLVVTLQTLHMLETLLELHLDLLLEPLTIDQSPMQEPSLVTTHVPYHILEQPVLLVMSLHQNIIG